MIAMAGPPPVPAMPRRAQPSDAGLPPTAELLTDGGDARIVPDPKRGLNKYGCSPFPDPDLAAFGSSTASTISSTAFAAADRLRERLAAAACHESPGLTYARELDRMRAELADLCGIADLPDLEIVFAASGTDLHLLAAQLAAGGARAPLHAVMMEAAETGSGVPAALAGRHFSTRTALGETAANGCAIDGSAAVEIAPVSSRGADGLPRPAHLVDAEVESRIVEAVTSGRRVLLTLVDVSKTGMIAPSPRRALAIRRRFPDAVDVLVDACQFRLSRASLRAYLEHGFAVALTGSKFLTGPTFSGALLVPRTLARRLRRQPLPSALGAYSAQAEWPRGWTAARSLPNAANYGLLLRWEAALDELRAFRSIPDPETAAFLADFARAVETRLSTDPAFEALPVPAPDRRPLVDAGNWDEIPTIFPFLLRGADRSLLGREETARVYAGLAQDKSALGGAPDMAALRCEVGQPVPCGQREGVPVSALRLCASARLAVEAGSARSAGAQVIARAMAVLDKAAWLGALR
jgi:selenocysteine lyase/cysteine desulfurase